MNRVHAMVSKVYGSTKEPGKAKASSEWIMGWHSPVGDFGKEELFPSHTELILAGCP